MTEQYEILSKQEHIIVEPDMFCDTINEAQGLINEMNKKCAEYTMLQMVSTENVSPIINKVDNETNKKDNDPNKPNDIKRVDEIDTLIINGMEHLVDLTLYKNYGMYIVLEESDTGLKYDLYLSPEMIKQMTKSVGFEMQVEQFYNLLISAFDGINKDKNVKLCSLIDLEHGVVSFEIKWVHKILGSNIEKIFGLKLTEVKQNERLRVNQMVRDLSNTVEDVYKVKTQFEAYKQETERRITWCVNEIIQLRKALEQSKIYNKSYGTDF